MRGGLWVTHYRGGSSSWRIHGPLQIIARIACRRCRPMTHEPKWTDNFECVMCAVNRAPRGVNGSRRLLVKSLQIGTTEEVKR